VIGDRRRREKSRDLQPAVAVRRAHHGGLDAHAAQSGDTLCPVSFDRGSTFELEAELGEKRDSGIEGLHHDAHVVHPLKRHAADSSRTCSSGEKTALRIARTRLYVQPWLHIR
jgi:hypothetical protein